MVNIRVVRMEVRERRMAMVMTMRLPPVPLNGVFMLMMCVVNVRVKVIQGFVRVFVLVPLGEMAIDAPPHDAVAAYARYSCHPPALYHRDRPSPPVAAP